jgi:hypothetical protein
MKISVRSGGTGKGWSNYTTRKYVKLSKEERSKIILLSGNTKLGDSIIKSSNYKENSTTLVLSFKGKVSDGKAKAVNEEFKELFMSGFKEDEYHYEAVLHQDTENTHIHIRIPTKNLVTDTQLRLYYHDNHKNFINAIRDYLIIKHELPQPTQENKQVFTLESKKERLIQEQRAKSNRNNFDFNKKNGRDEAKKYIANYIAELHESGLIESFDDLKELIESLDLEITRTGKDITGDFNYFTVQDKNSGKKIRLTGEVYNEQFWEDTRENREEQIRNNRIPSGANDRARTSLEEAEQRLEKEVRKRKEEVRKRYEYSRGRSQESHKNKISNNNTTKPIYRDYNRWNNNEIANDGEVRHNTEQPSTDIQIYEREAINDRARATIRARAKERETLLTTVRESITRPRTSLFEQFRENRESLYSKAKRVVPERRRAKANRKRDTQATKQLVAQVEKLGRAVYRARKQRYEGLGILLEKFGRSVDGEIARTLGNHYEQSDNTRQTAQELERAVKEVIEDREEPSYGFGMGM